jgi:hypothetical protein
LLQSTSTFQIISANAAALQDPQGVIIYTNISKYLKVFLRGNFNNLRYTLDRESLDRQYEKYNSDAKHHDYAQCIQLFKTASARFSEIRFIRVSKTEDSDYKIVVKRSLEALETLAKTVTAFAVPVLHETISSMYFSSWDVTIDDWGVNITDN